MVASHAPKRHVDFKAKTIRVEGQLERARTDDGNWLRANRVKYAKTDAGNRSIELIPGDLFKVLAEFKIASAHTADDDLVFGAGSGKPLDHRNVAKRFDAAKSRAKMDAAGRSTLDRSAAARARPRGHRRPGRAGREAHPPTRARSAPAPRPDTRAASRPRVRCRTERPGPRRRRRTGASRRA